jgi:excisionase family DNA binding protein
LADKPQRKPVQMSLFEQRTVSVAWVAHRLQCSRDTVVRLLQSNELRGYRLTPIGWWRVVEKSVQEYEQKLLQEYAPQAVQDAEKGEKSCQ